MSFLTPLAERPGEYEPALGDGRCHFFHVAAFNFAGLLTKIPGHIEIIGDDLAKIDIKNFSIDNVRLFMKSFHMQHKGIGFMIDSSDTTGYGKTLEIQQCPAGNPDNFAHHLTECAEYAYQDGRMLPLIGLWGPQSKERITYTEEEILSRINPEVAVVSSGQVFIDLGMFLEQRVQDEDLTLYLKTIFKVDEFLALKNAHPEVNLASPNAVQTATAAEASFAEKKIKPKTAASADTKLSEWEEASLQGDLRQAQRRQQPIAHAAEAEDPSEATKYSLPPNLNEALRVMEEKSTNLQSRGFPEVAETVLNLVIKIKQKYQDYSKNLAQKSQDKEKLQLLNTFKTEMFHLITGSQSSINQHRNASSQFFQSMGLLKDSKQKTDTMKKLELVTQAIFALEIGTSSKSHIEPIKPRK